MVQYRAAVIGLGQIGLTYDLDPKRERPSSHALAYDLHPQIELVAAADVSKEQGAVLHRLVPEVRFYQSLPELLQNHVPDIISICTPPVHHLPAIQYVLRNTAVRIIFCEKPLVRSLEEVAILKQALEGSHCLLVPNLSRRWNSGMQRVKAEAVSGKYGELQKIHVRYTRGIFNTGAHIFDLLQWWAGHIDQVQVIDRVDTSADSDNDPSFTFVFKIGDTINGFAEAFNDKQYYMFEIDLYFSQGRITIRNSGDEVSYYCVGEHHLFSGFNNLKLDRQESKLLADANLANAVGNLVNVLAGIAKPRCTIDDSIYPLYVAQALLRSHNNNFSQEGVGR
ncbi:Gfo/Idh/MocA family oxidoreductase [Sporomusa sp.]|uniref:Gfo/Idh/MocA family protein n=1 Tax=Sporomusa sp. TaxID=2078658 RepID=UPI002C2FF406|nr:Gfo/Idh/MocA family oxidoreductase [Sporomusa sp.]HWR45777.1 Gfo/Idh/MocA family oxidoreductase [Sporomusa sp.]